MTNTTNKGALRAGAAARTKRHAQRTPLPGDTARPVRGNPTAEALADHVAATKAPRKPRVKKTAAAATAPAVATPAKPVRDSRTFGDATDSLAAQVKEMRDGGAIWRDVAEALDLGPGKTGTSRARRLYKHIAGEKAPRRQARTRTAKPVHEMVDRLPKEDRPHAPTVTGGDMWHFQARDKRRGIGSRRMGPVNVGPIGGQQVRSLRRIFEGDGYTVSAVGHEPHSTCCKAVAS